MTRFVPFALAAAALAVAATSASAQLYPLTNGPNGTGTNTVDSAKGFIGSNAVASERELLYFPERGGNAAAALGITANPGGEAPPVQRRAQRGRRHPSSP